MTVFTQWSNADQFASLVHLTLDPIGEPRFVPLTHAAQILFGIRVLAVARIEPHLAVLQPIMFGESDEVVTVRFEPRRDHLGEIVSVTPQRVHVEIAFPPAAYSSPNFVGLAFVYWLMRGFQ